jgi:hypothetical protein
MANRRLLLILGTLALAACDSDVPVANQTAATTTEVGEAGTGRVTPAPAVTNTIVQPADPVASQMDFAALKGRWRVAAVAVGDGVQALSTDDPAYMGRMIDVGPERLAWAAASTNPSASSSDICNGPVTARQTGAAARDYDQQFAVQLARLKVAHPDPHAVECDSGEWGPQAAGGAIFFPAGDHRVAMSWYDGAMLLLEPAKP